ncbi:MAG: GTPase ObgE [bacterium]
MFVDKVKVYVKAGRGGNGCVSFRREKNVPRGGPDGGDGGKGGDVIAQAFDHINTLVYQYYNQHYRAENGEHGQGKNMHGRNGKDMIMKVPVGTIIRDAETNELIADLKVAGESVILARGGIGGKGNARFKSSTNQSPKIAEKGEPGEEKILELELRLIADVGLVGYPNAGKSSIISKVSASKPKIADYPFTTLSPNLGTVRIDEERSFVLADIPGLIEGAHAGVGLGDEFLRHITRTKALIHVVDVASVDGRDPVDDYEKINEELYLYDPHLAELPQIVAANKMDLPAANLGFQKLHKHLSKEHDRTIIPVSALTGEGLSELMYSAYQLLEKIKKTEKHDESKPEGMLVEYNYNPVFTITKEGSKYIINGKTIKRAVLMTNMENEFAVNMLHNKLKNMGVIKALTKLGAKDGDIIVVNGVEFTFTI